MGTKEPTYIIDEAAENKEIVRRYRKLLGDAKPVLKDGDTKVIKKAFNVAVEAHKEMRRKSGEPYIYHPIEVAQICVEEIGLGTTSIVAALLHDVVEDTDTTLEDIEKQFGKKVSKIIDGLTKIGGVFDHRTSQQAENFKKIVLTLTDDVRVILVKLADRLHNMRTLGSMPRHKQLKIASETIYVYAPLAHRLGLYAIKSELEDLYLKYTDNATYKEIANKLAETKTDRQRFIRNFIKPIQQQLRTRYFEFKIKGRPKSIYSIWKKMSKQGVPFEEVYDLFAIRIIISAKEEEEKAKCWQVYSLITDNYKPNPDRLRDWISTPKANGYESLHTTVMSRQGKWVEVQIRTDRMDDIAEKGYAAHWKYKAKNDELDEEKDTGLDNWIGEVRDLLKSDDRNDAVEFMDDFRSSLFNEEIFVFTPKGDLKVIPKKSTVLDFAFEIHTQIGLHCLGAKVNNRLVPITHQLKNGDQVEILTSNKQTPTEEWMRVAVTTRAKKRIKDFLSEGKRNIAKKGEGLLLRKLEQIELPSDDRVMNRLCHLFNEANRIDLFYKIGKGIINLKEISDFKDKDAIISAIKENDDREVTETINQQVKTINKGELVIGEDDQEFDYQIAACCNPIPGDDIFGFVNVNEGVIVHRAKCSKATELLSNYGSRVVKAQWKGNIEGTYLTGVRITGTDKVGLIHDITKVVSFDLNVNIKTMKAETKDGIIEDELIIYVRNKIDLLTMMEKLSQIPDVISVERIENEF